MSKKILNPNIQKSYPAVPLPRLRKKSAEGRVKVSDLEFRTSLGIRISSFGIPRRGRGSTLLLSLIILAITTAIGLTLTAFTVRELRATSETLASEPAIVAADAGGEQGIWTVTREYDDATATRECDDTEPPEVQGIGGSGSALSAKRCEDRKETPLFLELTADRDVDFINLLEPNPADDRYTLFQSVKVEAYRDADLDNGLNESVQVDWYAVPRDGSEPPNEPPGSPQSIPFDTSESSPVVLENDKWLNFTPYFARIKLTWGGSDPGAVSPIVVKVIGTGLGGSHPEIPKSTITVRSFGTYVRGTGTLERRYDVDVVPKR